MKYTSIFTVIVTLFVMNSCVSSSKYKNLKADYDSLAAEKEETENSYDQVLSYIDSLGTDMDKIMKQEQIIRLGVTEDGRRLSSRAVRENMEALQEAINKHKEQIAELEQLVNGKDDKIRKLQSVIDVLNRQIESKEMEIKNLRNELAAKQKQIIRLQDDNTQLQKDNSQLTIQNREQEQQLSIQTETLVAQDRILNEGYFVFGTRSELVSKHIVPAVGNRVNMKVLAPEMGRLVDIREFTSITLECKNMKVLSSVPEGSYTINRNGDGTTTLDIISPSELWGTSRYLVVQINK